MNRSFLYLRRAGRGDRPCGTGSRSQGAPGRPFRGVAGLIREAAIVLGLAAGSVPSPAQAPRQPASVRAGAFPVSIQFSAPDSIQAPLSDSAVLCAGLRDLLSHGFTDLWIRSLPPSRMAFFFRYASSLGIRVDWMTSGLEGFGRYGPPAVSVYSPGYTKTVKAAVRKGLGPVRNLPSLHFVFPFHDEPFHAGPASFDYSSYARAAFRKRYGYPMPDSLGAVRGDPEKRLDLLNFQSETFAAGWRRTYKIVKAFIPHAQVVMTHDSHNCFGGGVHSNSQVAMDDVFHWGGGFADRYVYDIYPYQTFDYRYGEPGRLPLPRMSQMHYTISQMRDMTTAWHKKLGFWVGTYNKLWFDRFRGPERKHAWWSEREMAFTAIAQGAGFLISPSAYDGAALPMDSAHWSAFGQGMRLVQRAGAGLLRSPKVKAKACFLFPRTQYLLEQREYYNVGLSFELFLRAFGELDMLHEDQVTDGSLEGYKVLVLCDVDLLPETVAAHIAEFVRRGGIVIADCVPQLDEAEHGLETMRKLFGVRGAATERIARRGQWVPFTTLPPKMSFPPPEGWEAPETGRDSVSGMAFGRQYRFGVVSPRAMSVSSGKVVLRMRSGEPALVVRKSGKGKAYVFGFCLQDSYFATWKDSDTVGRAALRELIAAVFADAGVRAHVRSTNPAIEAAVRSNGLGGYVLLINHECRQADTRVRLCDLGFPAGKLTDVATGRPVPLTHEKDGVAFRASVPFGTVRLLRLEAEGD